MVDTTRMGNHADRQSQSSPPLFQLFRPAHLRLYGADASSSLNLPRRRSPAAVPRAGLAEGPSRTRGNGGANEASDHGSSRKHPPWSGTGTGNRGVALDHKALPFAPPAMSARCQLHPCALQGLGASPGDPVLAFFSSAGSGTRLLVEEGEANPPARPAGPPHIRGGVVVAFDQEAGTGGGGAKGMRVAESGESVQEGSPANGTGRASCVGVDEDCGTRQPGSSRTPGKVVEGSTLAGGGGVVEGQRHLLRNSPRSRDEDEARQESGWRLDSEERSDLTMVRCFLCTVWANPHLSPAEVAVDGRVSVPLNGSELSSVGALRSIDGGVAIESPNSHNGNARRDPPRAVYLLSVFLRALVECSSAGKSDGAAESVVGVFPLNNAVSGLGTLRSRAGAEAAELVPLGMRITVRVPRPFAPAVAPSKSATIDTSTSGLPPEYTSLVKRSMRHLVVSDGCDVAVPELPNPEASFDGAEAISASASGGAGPGNNHSRQRHDDGTVMARIGPFSTGAGSSSTRGVGPSSSPSQASPMKRSVYAGQPGGQERGGALSALLGGALCAVGPDALLLVETEVADVPTTFEEPRKHYLGGVGGIERADGGGRERAKTSSSMASNRAGRGGDRGRKRGVAPMSPTDALVELMLLPMEATPPSDGSTALEFLIPRGVLLTGPPGVGKTYAVKSAVEVVRKLNPQDRKASYQVRLTTLNGAEVLSMGQWEACRALREAFSSAEDWTKRGFPSRGRRCAVIFLDEADGLLARRDRDGDKSGGGEAARPLAQLLTLMDGFQKAEGAHVIVIGATNRPAALDPALRRPGRFDRELALAPPDVGGRVDILRHHLRRIKVMGGKDTLLEAAKKCVGYVGADLAALAREAALLAVARRAGSAKVATGAHMEALSWGGDGPKGSADATCVAVWPQDLAVAMEKVGASSLRGHHVTVPDTPWSDIGGMEQAKSKLRQAVEWPAANRDALERMGLTPPRGILLFGPPGCSKTTLVRAAATAARTTFVSLSGADVFSPYLGEAEAAVRQAFLLARNAAPALLFFDEIDAIVCKRDAGNTGSSNSAESRVLATFLTEMDGVGSLRGDGVIVVGATNRPEAVDKALLRPGRFDQLVYAPLPNADARRQIFEVHTRKMTLERGGVDYVELAKVSEGLTGAEIEGVCREAAMSAIRETGIGDMAHPDRDRRDDSLVDGAEPATVKMRHLMSSARAYADRPGVTPDMIAAYERFAAGL